ncbi:MAG: AcrR family transcriptional regulator [Verrucomicrobiales bacterium]|jgi:AcrR family transcriptional regulator
MTILDTTTANTSSEPAPAADSIGGRQRILRAAAELFLSRGYAETSVRTIADAVDMRPASIYHHFESKDALLTEILEIGMEAVMTAFVDAEESLTSAANGRDRLRTHIAAHLHALFAHHAFTAAHVTVFPFAPPEVRAESVPDRDAYEARWTMLFESITEDLDPEAIRLTRLALFGAMNSTVQWFDPAEGSVDDLASAIVGTLWDGIGRAPGDVR